jgi:hypothetical protein
MERLRFSLAGLMGLVLLLAVAMVALRSANTLWAALVAILVVGALIVAIPCIAQNTGGKRSFWIGFAFVGWSYFILIYAPWFNSHVGKDLPPTRLLNLLYSQLVRESSPRIEPWCIAIWIKPDRTLWIEGHHVANDSELQMVFVQVISKKKPPYICFYSNVNNIGSEFPRIFNLLRPPGLDIDYAYAAAYELPERGPFALIGNCLAAASAAIIGGLLAGAMQSRGGDVRSKVPPDRTNRE